MKYKIPEKVFNDFEYIGGRNYSTKDHKHIETFAYMIGEEESSNEILVKELIYPDQDGQPCNVIHSGMTLDYPIGCVFFQICIHKVNAKILFHHLLFYSQTCLMELELKERQLLDGFIAM